MKLDSNFKFTLNKEQHDKLLEMAKWVFDDCEVTSPHFDSYTLRKEEKKSTYSYSYTYVNYLHLLLFHIPLKLGMDIVICDPQNPNILFEEIYEKYRIYNNIPEKSIKKNKYKDSIEYYNCCL